MSPLGLIGAGGYWVRLLAGGSFFWGGIETPPRPVLLDVATVAIMLVYYTALGSELHRGSSITPS